MIKIDLSKQHALVAGSKSMQQINFLLDLDKSEKLTVFLHYRRSRRNILDFSKETMKKLKIVFVLI